MLLAPSPLAARIGRVGLVTEQLRRRLDAMRDAPQFLVAAQADNRLVDLIVGWCRVAELFLDGFADVLIRDRGAIRGGMTVRTMSRCVRGVTR